MAQVYLARDTRLGREVAVKVLDPKLAQRSGFRDRFLREARVVAALDHPNIVNIYEVGESGGVLFLVMPYLSGGSLQEALKRVPFPVSEVISFGTQITDALDYAHQRGVIHRDVKPANMLLHSDGRLMLADFGLAKILDGSDRPANRQGKPDAGTPEYMAPEQIQGRTDARSDLYGLGVVLYLLLTGKLPFSGASANTVMDGHLYQLAEHPRAINRAVTPALDEVIMRALAKHPDERFQRASEMGAALLEALVAGEAEPIHLDTRSPSPVFSRPPSLEPSGLPPMPSPLLPSPFSHGQPISAGGIGSQGGYARRSGGQGGSISFLPSLDVPAVNSPSSGASSAGPFDARQDPIGTPYLPRYGPEPGLGFAGTGIDGGFSGTPREYLPTRPLSGPNGPSGGTSHASATSVGDPLSQISQGLRAGAVAQALSPAPSPGSVVAVAATVADSLDEVHGRSPWVWVVVGALLLVLVLAAGGLAYFLL
jgi:serine/threonine protein kinase